MHTVDRGLRLFALLALADAAAGAEPLRLARVDSTSFNCRFTASCTLPVNDSLGPIAVPFASGDGRLQSRLSDRGEPGTPGAGLLPYVYRVDLTAAGALTARSCVDRLAFDFGPIEPLDYDGDGRLDDVAIIDRAALGTVAPSAADRSGRIVTFTFAPAVCPGSRPGGGESSFFFALASRGEPRELTATAGFTLGDDVAVAIRVPAIGETPPPTARRDCALVPAGPPGVDSVPIDPSTPACRCFQDLALRLETQCGFLSPDLFLAWRIPFPVAPGEPFRIERATFPTSKAGGAARLRLEPPAGFVRLTPPADGKSSIEGVWLVAPSQPGRYEARLELDLPGRGGAGNAKSSIGFPIEVRAPKP